MGLRARAVAAVYSLHLCRPSGEETQAVTRSLDISSTTQAGALREAARLWELQPDVSATGYRLVHNATGVLVYEYRKPE